MKRFLILLLTLVVVVSFSAIFISAQTKDKLGEVKIKKGEPIHIACWMVVAGPDASLGTDTKRGVETRH